MSKEAPKIYVGCKLTGAPEEFVQDVEAFKELLREQEINAQNYQVFDFLGVKKGTAGDVYRTDLGCVRRCDIFIPICDYPSTGMGMELMEAIHLGKSVLAIAHQDSNVTRMIEGAAEVEPNVQFQTYQALSDTLPIIRRLASGQPLS